MSVISSVICPTTENDEWQSGMTITDAHTHTRTHTHTQTHTYKATNMDIPWYSDVEGARIKDDVSPASGFFDGDL